MKEDEIKRFVCIHGHFYQPPRENAWLETVEIQESAKPYHDWNERITMECYGANTMAKILNDDRKIVDIINNYSKISFNVGPTLMSWFTWKNKAVHDAIVEADKISIRNYGQGSAMAQVYNHIIMPLANRRDKETQVKWGLYDFERRFGRKAEGIWLAETAVDTETLEICADNGIKYTILAPSQAKAYRKLGEEGWTNGIQPNFPYVYNLPNGKRIFLFFYDGKRSQEVAFNGVLNDGKYFAKSLLSGLDSSKSQPQLLHIATDGETYGHHHPKGEMALAYCLAQIEKTDGVALTNYASFLAKNTVQFEVQIYENSSWSCFHGVERWRSNCGCETGGKPGFNQKWRQGLREALDWLRDSLIPLFENGLKPHYPDPWMLRNKYIEIFFERNEANIQLFFDNYLPNIQDNHTKTTVLRLLEMQRQAMYMFTSCGWFFNDVSGIETVQILQYANRAIQLAKSETGVDLEPTFKLMLGSSISNYEEYGSAKDIYEKWVSPKTLTLTKVGMHYAVSSLFQSEGRVLTIFNYDCQSRIQQLHRSGNLILSYGITEVRSRVTLSEKVFSYIIVYMGGHHLIGNSSDLVDETTFKEITENIKLAFEESNITKVLDLMRNHFKDHTFSYFDLLKDEQLKLLEKVIEINEESALSSYEMVNNNTYALMTIMHNSQLEVPELFLRNLQTLVQVKLENRLEILPQLQLIPIRKLKGLADDVIKWKIGLNTVVLEFMATKFFDAQKNTLFIEDIQEEYAENILKALEILELLKIQPSLNGLQNIVFNILKNQGLSQGSAIKALAAYIDLA